MDVVQRKIALDLGINPDDLDLVPKKKKLSLSFAQS
jgi:hypothetical protein